MKISTLITLLVAIVLIASSCTKNYTCVCTYNNTVVYSTQIDNKKKNDAKNICSQFDSTVAGERWTCTTQ